MNKLVFKVNGPKDGNLAPLIKEITRIECRIYLDVENGFVTVENVNDDLIDSVIDLINTYYILLGVEIDNLVEDDRVVLSVEEFPPESTEDSRISDDACDEPAAKVEIVDEEPATSELESIEVGKNVYEEVSAPAVREVEPQSPEDLIIKKVEFQNPAIEAAINKLSRTAFWAMYKQSGSEKEIVNFIWTAIREMSLRYNNTSIIEFSFGDIVDCYFGTHLPMEINGSHVLGIVADITADNLVYIVPITKATEDIDSKSYITFYRDADVYYYSDQYLGGTALIDKARYLRAERLQSVVGKAKPDFLVRLIEELPDAFNFRHNIDALIEEIYGKTVDNTTGAIASDVEAFTTELPSDDADTATETTVQEGEKTTLPKNNMTSEDILSIVVGDALELLEPGGSILNNTRTFLEAIGMPTDNPALNEAFLAASDIKKINYENIIAAVRETNKELSEDEIKEALKEAFKSWLATKEELASYNRLALTSLLKLFAKAVRA